MIGGRFAMQVPIWKRTAAGGRVLRESAFGVKAFI